MSDTDHACPMCDWTAFVDGKCGQCGRPLVPDREYFDDIEMLAKEVVDAAYDEYGDLRGTATGSELQRAIVRLADRVKQYHWQGDGCVDED